MEEKSTGRFKFKDALKKIGSIGVGDGSVYDTGLNKCYATFKRLLSAIFREITIFMYRFVDDDLTWYYCIHKVEPAEKHLRRKNSAAHNTLRHNKKFTKVGGSGGS